jgi:hypothetical protein
VHVVPPLLVEHAAPLRLKVTEFTTAPELDNRAIVIDAVPAGAVKCGRTRELACVAGTFTTNCTSVVLGDGDGDASCAVGGGAPPPPPPHATSVAIVAIVATQRRFFNTAGLRLDEQRNASEF